MGLDIKRIKKRNDVRWSPERKIISGFGSEPATMAGPKGVNGCILKPVGFSQFRETVRPLGFYWLVINQALPVSSQEVV